MRDTKRLIASALAGPRHQSKGSRSRQLDPKTVEVVNWLFGELKTICHAWRRDWPDDRALAAAKRSWVRAFVTAGINSTHKIERGLMRCRLRSGPLAALVPTSGQFIEWCTPNPEELGLPSSRDAYRQATRMAHPTASLDDMHPAVYHAACEVGFYELTQLSELASRRLFDRAYTLTVQMVLNDHPLREVPKALPETASVSTPEVGRRALMNLREMLAS